MPSSALWGGDRRLEAETYLKSGSGVRLALESVPRACAPLGEHARVIPADTQAHYLLHVMRAKAGDVFTSQYLPAREQRLGK